MKIMKIVHLLLTTLVAFALVPQVVAQEQQQSSDVRTLGTRITGNQEQPKVLYIIPWKSALQDAAVAYRPVIGQADSVFRHVERDEHQRQIDFLQEYSAGKQ